MAIRQRAIQAEDKFERHHAILDAAGSALARMPDRLPSMAEVADAAGLAKGTIYLYFPSKEELYLALHERNLDAFFRELCTRADESRPVEIAELYELTRKHMVEPPLFLPLAARCFGLMAHSISPEAARGFKDRMVERLALAGAALERHFPALAPGAGIGLLRQSYALVIGLWQMSGETCPSARTGSSGAGPTYPEELRVALAALWTGALAIGSRAP